MIDLFRLTSIALFLFISISSGAQENKVQLERNRNKLIKDIELTKELYAESQKKRKQTLGDLRLLEKQIDNQDRLINVLEKEVNILATEEKYWQDSVNVLLENKTNEIERYGAMLNSAHINSRLRSPVKLLIDGVSLLEGFKKWVYLNQYNRYVERKLIYLSSLEDEIVTRKKTVDSLLVEKQEALDIVAIQKQRLDDSKSQMSKTLYVLKKDMRSLSAKTTGSSCM